MLTVYKNIFHSGPQIKIEYYEEEREKGVRLGMYSPNHMSGWRLTMRRLLEISNGVHLVTLGLPWIFWSCTRRSDLERC